MSKRKAATPPIRVGDARHRDRDVAAYDALIASRPLRPPSSRALPAFVQRPGEVEARRYALESLEGAPRSVAARPAKLVPVSPPRKARIEVADEREDTPDAAAE